MKGLISIVGVMLLILGIAALTYQGFTYTTQEKVAQIGDIEVTAEKHKSVYLPPLLGGLSLVIGGLLVFLGRKQS